MSYFNVRPRYTPGSPAMVNVGLAWKVAEEERHAIDAELEGFYGEKHVGRAKRLGLHRIAFHLREKGGAMIVTDLLTRERYERAAKYKLGEKVEVWDDENGWVEHVVTKDYRSAAHDWRVHVRPSNVEAWQGKEREVIRDEVRAPRTVKVLDPEEVTLRESYSW